MANALIVGCGAIGSGFDADMEDSVALTHAAGYEQHETTELVAGVDPDQDHRVAFSTARGVPAYETITTAVRNHDIDLVSLCTPTETRTELITPILNADIDGLLCEKPIADTSSEAQAILGQCRDAGITVAVNYFRRYLPGCQHAETLLTSGKIGAPRAGLFIYNKGFLNNGSHMVDLARWWFGTPTGITALEGEQPTVLLDFDGVRVHVIWAGDWTYNHTQAEVYGTAGRLQLLDHGRTLGWQPVSESPLFAGFEDLGETTQVETGFERMCYFAVDNLVAAIDGEAPLACSGEEALRTLELCERITDS